MTDSPMARVPNAARGLGAAGLIPFVACSVAVIAGGPALALAWTALTGYAAVILAFMGAVHWGLAMRDAAPSWVRLGGSVVPPLLAWVALLLPVRPGLLLMALGFTALFVADRMATERGLAPSWYPRLRLPLTAVVVLSLLAAALLGRSA